MQFFSVPPSLGTTIKNSFQQAANDTVTMFSELLPIALTVFVFAWGTKKAMRFFKTSTN